MDCQKVGARIYNLRKERGLTQKELADSMHLSDKTVSKWERGLGCPDVSVLVELAEKLGVNVEQLLEGSATQNRPGSGSLERVRFYVCPRCGNVLMTTGEADIFCCGKSLEALQPKPADEVHTPEITPVEDELYLTFPHEMSRKSHIGFVAHAAYDRATVVKLYPEQEAAVRMPSSRRGKWFVYCSEHGLLEFKVK